MTTGIFVARGISAITQQLHIVLHDFWDDGEAVWKCQIGDEVRYVEGRMEDDIWVIIDRAARAYEDEDEDEER